MGCSAEQGIDFVDFSPWEAFLKAWGMGS